MLYREAAEGLVAISQPAHAWLAGQFARSWGNARFGSFAPREPVCLAAEQHDLGWLPWESAPSLDPVTGRPPHFLQMPLESSLRIWSSAGPAALAFGRYPALLVSLHGTGLFGARDRSGDPAEAAAIDAYLAGARAFEQSLLTSLRADPALAPHAAPEIVARNRRLVAVWDRLSLLLCMGLRQSEVLERVPAEGGEITLELRPSGEEPGFALLSPWPFRAGEFRAVVEGRRLGGRYSELAALHAGLAAAPWVRLEICLRPASP